MSLTKSELVAVRDAVTDDRNFILSTFLRGLYHGGSPFSNMKKQTFMEKYHALIENVLQLPTTKVRVACLKEDPNVILGYSIHNGSTSLSWVFVKKSWRGIGLAKDLVPQTIKTYSHYTKVGLIIAKKKELDYDPFLI